MRLGRGRRTFLEKGFSSPSPNPTPSSPKTFDWWGGGAEGVPVFKDIGEIGRMVLLLSPEEGRTAS